MKRMIVLAAVAAVVFALAPAAPATPVTVLNPSFEYTVNVNVGGTNYNRAVDILDAQKHGYLAGHLQDAGQPTGSWDPRDWDCGGTNAGDGVAVDARWPNWWNSYHAGPTDGLQSIILDNRTTWTNPTQNWMKQTIGTVGDFAGYSQLVLSFDARYDGSGVDPEGDDYFEAYFEVGGVKGGDDFYTLLDQTRLVRNYSEMGTPLPPNSIPPAKSNPGVPVSVGPQNMDTFTATLDLGGLDPADTIRIAFHNYRDRLDTGAASPSSRIYLDNVRVEAVRGGGQPPQGDIPEPATMCALGLALAGLSGYVRRRRRLA